MTSAASTSTSDQLADQDPLTGPGVVSDEPADRRQIDEVADRVRSIAAQVETVLQGKTEVVRQALVVLLAGGHLLIEDDPGVGKTMLCKALGRAMGCDLGRVQFTPDLLPSDVTGVSIYDQEERSFEFRPGPVFAHLVLGDEINRASPKTQSALLECMEEGQVTVDGVSHVLARPFMVVATQNPIEMDGTHPLPAAQRDRFLARIAVGYPSPAAEAEMLLRHGVRDPLQAVEAVTDAAAVARMIDVVSRVHVAPEIRAYAVELVAATRRHPELTLGGSPRATLHLVRAARSAAALDRRHFVRPDDVKWLLEPVLAHRLRSRGRPAGEILREIGSRVSPPGTPPTA